MHLTTKHYITTFIRAEQEHRRILSNLILKIKSHFLLVHCLDPICSHTQRQVAKVAVVAEAATTTTTSIVDEQATTSSQNACKTASSASTTTTTTTAMTTSTMTTASTTIETKGRDITKPQQSSTSNNNQHIDLHIFNCIEEIFLNGLRAQKPDHSPDVWRFIEGLYWLNPQMTTSIANRLQSFANQTNKTHYHIPLQRIRNNRALLWIYECLETKTLSKKLKYLLSDHEHLANCYEITAYMHSKRYVNALFCCLNAIELERPELLSEIDNSLYEIRSDIGTGTIGEACDCNFNVTTIITSGNPNDEVQHQSHKQQQPAQGISSCLTVDQCTRTKGTREETSMGNNRSLPVINYEWSPASSRHSSVWGIPNALSNEQESQQSVPEAISSSSKQSMLQPSSERRHKRRTGNRLRFKCKHTISQRLRPWISLPDIRIHSSTCRTKKTLTRSKSLQLIRNSKSRNKLTAENLALNEQCLTPITALPTPGRSHRCHAANGDSMDLTPINLVKCDNIKIHMDCKVTPHQREDSSALAAMTVPSANLTTPDTSSKPNGKFTEFWRNIPGKRNLFFSSMRPDESGGSSGEKQANSAPGDFVNTFLPPQVGEKIEKRYNHNALEDVVNDTETPLLISQLPMASSTAGAKMQPTRGQSLTSYLQALQAHRVNVTDLERENAHFDLSDAIISAIEEAKYLHRERLKDKQIKAVRRSKKRLAGRSRRLRSWCNSDANNCEQLSSVEQSDSELSPSSSVSVELDTLSDSDLSHASNNSATSLTSDGEDNEGVGGGNGGDLRYLQIFSVSSHSINDHAAYAEWADNSFESYSAEGIALSLISKFKDKQLPSASDILSDGTAAADDPMSLYLANDPYGMRQLTCTRGTANWAPPRPQIIFTRHPTPDRKRLLQLQNNKCAGCGMVVAPHLSHYFRFCEYLGKYHCTGCHRNQINAIPARILDRWDFSCHPVSVFAYRLLEQMWKVPLFRVPDLNKELYGKVRALRLARLRRTQLKYITDYIRLCRFADETRQIIDKCPPYFVDDVDLWSLNDFVAVRSGTFVKEIQRFIAIGEDHVYNCELCTNRAFLCEYCDVKQVIFPWQNKVMRCDNCGACAHSSCWEANTDCSKCRRLQQRKQSNAG